MKIAPHQSLGWRAMQFLVSVCLCALLVLSNALPAAALPKDKTSPTEGEEQLSGIIRKTEEVSRSTPRNLEEVQKDTEGGLNEIQGKADIEKMSTPENSRKETSVETQIKEGLRNLIN